MTGHLSADSIGARIQLLRKSRGMRTAKDLADAIGNSNLTESVIENIEAGRKTDLPVSQVLNIAYALQVPPTYLLVALNRTGAVLDLPNLSPQLASMSPSQFDSWLSGAATGAFRSATAAEFSSRAELDAWRELGSLQRELHRIQTVQALEVPDTAADSTAGDLQSARLDARRLEIGAQIERLETFLRSAGWDL